MDSGTGVPPRNEETSDVSSSEEASGRTSSENDPLIPSTKDRIFGKIDEKQTYDVFNETSMSARKKPDRVAVPAPNFTKSRLFGDSLKRDEVYDLFPFEDKGSRKPHARRNPITGEGLPPRGFIGESSSTQEVVHNENVERAGTSGLETARKPPESEKK